VTDNRLIARSAGATAQVHFDNAYPVTVNDIPLTERMVPTLERVAGKEKVFVGQKIMGCEDFSYYQQKIPGFFYFIGITPRPIDQSGVDLNHAAPNHSPRFFVDESALLLGARSLAHLTLDYMASPPKAG
jgi:amidohydrolase